MSWAAVGVGVASIGISVGMAASGAGQPTQPNLASSSRQLSNTNAALLPIQRGMTAAQQSGGDYSFTLPKGMNSSGLGITTSGQGWYDTNGNLVSTDQNYGTPQATPSGKWGVMEPKKNSNVGLTWRPGTASLNGVPITQNKDGSYTVSFKGMGQADVESTIANQSAQNQLALSQKFDPQFIAQALSEQQQADPQSFAARQEESKLIQDQIDRPINSPVSDMLNSQVQDTLNAANNHSLTGMDTERLNAAVASAQGARGGPSTPGDFASPLTTGFAGEQRQGAAAQAAMGFLGSGSSPEDLQYRREQQNLANLSAEVNGKTPQAQFGSMSGAQSGPTPMMTGGPLPVMPGGQDEAAQQAAIQSAQTTNRYNASQSNPWLTGVGSLINLGGVAGSMGWKPFAPSS